MKSEKLLATSEVAALLDSTAQLRSAKGWLCEIWSGEDPIRLRNLRFLGAGRRLDLADQDTIVKVGAAGIPGTTLR